MTYMNECIKWNDSISLSLFKAQLISIKCNNIFFLNYVNLIQAGSSFLFKGKRFQQHKEIHLNALENGMTTL